ncbi:MAG TPA: S9 family peptidase [Symbiobacteriaceae bacterium]|nr:S9 family peptidase [Symbiobacteriaceae bacterium]
MTSRLQLADYYNWHTISGIAIAPDGRRAVYVQRGARKAKNDHYTNLWLADTDGAAPHRLTRTLSRDSAPAFSPDGRYLAFLSTREHELEIAEAQPKDAKKDEKPKTQVWLFDLQYGGEPRQITTLAEGVSEFDWAPDSARLVLAARTPTPGQQKYLESLRGEELGPYQLRRMQHKADSTGFLDEVRTHLHVVEVTTRAIRQLTDGPCDEEEPRWSPDGDWILFTSNRTGSPDANHREDLWLVRPDGSESRRLTFGDLSAYGPRWSPDSRRIAFVSSLMPENSYKLRHTLVIDVAAAEPVADLAACVGVGWSEIGGLVPDQFDATVASAADNARRYPVPLRTTPYRVLTGTLDRTMMGTPRWLDDATLLTLAGDRGQTRLLRLSLTGEATFVYPTDRFHEVQSFETAAGRLIINVDSPTTGPDLYAFPAADPAGADPVRLTALNGALLADRSLAAYERVAYTGSRGDTVEALVALPPGWTPAAGPAPLVVSIHGGPMAYDAPSFHFLRQYWAGMGYLVLMVNYHGSISYGEAFCEAIRGCWGPTEHGDVEAGVDELIARGWADPGRLFVTGFSQGGIMTNWAVGHTDRFRAAVSEHGMWNYLMSYGTDDCHRWWQDDLGVPWQNAETYARISPAASVANIKTPTLIMAGEHDWRCPLVESEQMYIGLQKRGVPTQLVVWQGEWHSISKPRRMVDRIRRICSWFGRYGGLPLTDETAEGYPDLD